MQEGEIVWWPEQEEGHLPTKSRYPIDIRIDNSLPNTLEKGDQAPEVVLKINFPVACQMRWVRVGHRLIDFESGGSPGVAITRPFRIYPHELSRSLQIHLSFYADGQCRRASYTINHGIGAFLLEQAGKITLYKKSKALNVRNARGFIYHLPIPEVTGHHQGSTRRYWLLEGTRILRSVPKRGFSIQNLAGYGESLHLQHGLYNPEEAPQELISRVRDNVRRTPKFGHWKAKLSYGRQARGGSI